MSRKIRGSVAAMLITAGLLAGCGGDDDDDKGSSSSGESGKATLSLMAHTSNQGRLKPLVDRYNESQSDVTIKASYLPFEQYTSTLQTQLQAGSAPDIFGSAGGNPLPLAVWPLGSSGKLLDMSDRPWVADLDPALRELVSTGGKTYGVPLYESSAEAIFFNVPLFKELGLRIPQQFSEVLDMCKKTVAAGKIPLADGFADAVGPLHYITMAMVNNVYSQDKDWTEQRDAGKTTFAETKGWRRVYEQLVEMKDAGCFAESPEGITATQAQAAFTKGDAVMLLSGASNVPALEKLNPELEIDSFNLPPDDGANAMLSQLPSDGMVASADTEHPEQVRAFFDFASLQEQRELVAEVNGGVLPEDLAAGKVPDYMRSTLPLIREKRYMIAPVAKWPDPVLLSVASDKIVGLFTGQSSPDEILKDLDTAWDQAIAKQK